jgi:hypothetical protein
MKVDNLTLALREDFHYMPQCLLKPVNIGYREEICLYKKIRRDQLGIL